LIGIESPAQAFGVADVQAPLGERFGLRFQVITRVRDAYHYVLRTLPRAGCNGVGAQHRQRRCPPPVYAAPACPTVKLRRAEWGHANSPTRKALASVPRSNSGEDHAFAGVFCADECLDAIRL